MHLVTDVERYEERRHGLDDAGVFQLAAVDGTHTGDLNGQIRGDLSGPVVVAADDDVAIDIVITVEHRRGKAVECGSDCNRLADDFGCLLGRRTLPYAQNSRRAAANRGSKWNGCIDQNGSLPK